MTDTKFFADDHETWGHKWGYKDSGFILNDDRTVIMTGSRYELCGAKMPDFIPYIEEVLDIKINPDDRLKEIGNKLVNPPNINESFLTAVENKFPADRFSFKDEDRLVHSHGQTTSEEVYKILYNCIDRTVDMVFYLESDDETIQLINLASEYNVCLVPFGGGTSVSSALKIPASEMRMVVSVDLRRMNKVEWINEKDRRISVQAGITGSALEDWLGERGFCMGHEPDSVELSTLGGWIATNASGMKKNKYGNIEDIVENVTMITPKGIIEQIEPLTRASIGFKPQNILFGSEGNLGIITKAVLKIHQKPEVKKYNSAVFKNWEAGVEFLYDLSRTNFIPSSVRFVDNLQFRFGQALKPRTEGLKKIKGDIEKFFVLNIKGFKADEMCVATFVMEGTGGEVAYQEKNILALAKQHGGLVGGSGNGKRGYMLTYAIAYVRDFLTDFHIIGETMETTVPWSKIHDVCQAAKNILFELHAKHGIPGKPYISYRIPQIYHTGVCIYFMLGMNVKGIPHSEDLFGGIEHSIRRAIMDHGGSVSHHHGIGKLRKDFMVDTLSDSSIELIRNMKKSHDAGNVFGIRNGIFAD
ncbi:MAG: FAD-binding oxidoreductase [Candidatus Marinimicrobia bacterium]|jgi:alkyldihydroxyacetonephosphate synthase|nr:FAD-binding oxidoreductase [Candidatus Neomarinimicrobiota bacterium]|tara:strand:+ start:7036 stop:8790 length:1755 start_codon:yes stop_codon:yes gene_type:complete